MRIGEVRKVVPRQADPAPRDAELAATEQAEAGRAMVALTPAAGLRLSAHPHQEAPFLAQLLATKGQHPQTRERRRAAPETALAAYQATSALTRF